MIRQMLPAVAVVLLLPLHSVAFVSVGGSRPAASSSSSQRKVGSSPSLMQHFSASVERKGLEHTELPLTSKIEELKVCQFPQEEKLIDRNLHGYEPAEGIFLNVKGALSHDLMNEMKQKAMLMKMTFNKIRKYEFTANGQGGLFLDDGKSVVFSARHNIQDYESEGAFNEFEIANGQFANRFKIPIDFGIIFRRQTDKSEIFTFDDGDVWDNYDFVKSEPRFQEEMMDGKFFKWATNNFVLKPGMKVGMAVKRSKKPRLTWSATGANKFKRFPFLDNAVDLLSLVGFEDPELLAIYGRSENVCFYTGEITAVTQDGRGFKHNINTFQGCSGAIIFLLDEGNDGLVEPENYGKAVGLHAGGMGENEAVFNVGFCRDE